MALSEKQIPKRYRAPIDDEIELYGERRSITVKNNVPDTTAIPIEHPRNWLRIPDVVCVFVDMKDSTKLSADHHDNGTAGAYRLFASTAVRLFSEFKAPYIDVRGDGVLALFDKDQPYRALAAAVTFKTFATEEFRERVRKETDLELDAHIGIDQKTVLVRKVGFKRHRGRSDRQNEVWAGKPVNMAAKLAARSCGGELQVSDRYYSRITDDLVRLSCGCSNGERGEKVQLWREIDVSDDDKFDFAKAYGLGSQWCSIHGEEYCNKILALDDD